MDSKILIERTIEEARKIKSLPNKKRDEMGFYATNSDLNQLIKTLNRIANPKERKRIKSLDSLIRQVGDYAPFDSELYILVKKVVKTC